MALILLFLVVFILWIIIREKISVNKHKKNTEYKTENIRNLEE